MPDFIVTPTLRVAYESGGRREVGQLSCCMAGRTIRAPTTRSHRHCRAKAFATIVPFLRGFGATSFLSKDGMRSGEMVAMAQDALDVADALKLDRFAVVGHDWGARIAYAMAILWPERVSRICAMSVGWQPGELPTPGFEQVRKY